MSREYRGPVWRRGRQSSVGRGEGTEFRVQSSVGREKRKHFPLLMGILLLFVLACALGRELRPPPPVMNSVTLEGKAFYIVDYGGLIGFENKKGERFHLHGIIVDEVLFEFFNPQVKSISITLTGYVPDSPTDAHGWGQVFNVLEYQW